MIELKLTPRLQVIADSIDQCETLSDVGTDHAHLPIYLVQTGKVKKAIASDINKGPIDIAAKRIAQFHLQNEIETRQGSGLTVLKPNEADAIVIAGMGGMLISDIIEQSRPVAEAAEILILQPMLDSGKLRIYLMKNGFEIVHEELAKEEKKIYEIIWAKYTGAIQEPKGQMNIGEKIIEKKHPLAIELIDREITELKNILEKLGSKETGQSQKRIQECQELLNYYNEVKKWVQ